MALCDQVDLMLELYIDYMADLSDYTVFREMLLYSDKPGQAGFGCPGLK